MACRRFSQKTIKQICFGFFGFQEDRRRLRVSLRYSRESLKMVVHDSMTQLLMHTVAHSTRLSFKPKTNNQPTKKSCGHLSKSHQNVQNSDFQSQFSMSKRIRIFPKKISLKNIICVAYFLLLTFLTTPIFKPLIF